MCSVGGCSNKVHAKGVCCTYGRKPCSVDGCSTKERPLVQQAHGEAVLRRSRLRHPASPWQVCLHLARRLWILHHRRVHQQRYVYEWKVWETRQQDSGVLCGRLQNHCCCTRTVQEARRTWDLLVQQVHQCCPSQRPMRQARRSQQESVQRGRLHHSCSCTWRLWEARCKRNVQVCRMHHQRNANSGSLHCFKHGGGKKKLCSVAGCTTNSQRKGLCAKHGGGPGEYVFGGCTNQIWWETCGRPAKRTAAKGSAHTRKRGGML